MIHTHLILATLMYALPTYAQTGLPDFAIGSAQSIFRFVPLNTGDNGEATTAEMRAEALSQTCPRAIDFIAKLRCAYIRDVCDKVGMCRIPYTTEGTAFLIEDGQTLITAFHIAGDKELTHLKFLGGAMRNYPLDRLKQIYRDYRPDFLLFNHMGELIYDTREYNEPHVFDMVGDPLREHAKDRPIPAEFEAYAYDFARFRLRKALGPGLKTRIPQQTDVVWAMGYPAATTGRALNYDGSKFYINQGVHYPVRELFKELDPRIAETIPLIVMSNDIVKGFSGGPILNDAGEVIGVITATLSEPESYEGLAFGAAWRDFSEYDLRKVDTSNSGSAVQPTRTKY